MTFGGGGGDVTLQLDFPFLFGLQFQSMGWCDLHSRWVFSPQSNLSRNPRTYTTQRGVWMEISIKLTKM